MTLSEVKRLYDYNAWANRRVSDTLRLLDQERFIRDLRSSHGSIRGTVAHLAGAEWIWRQRWSGSSPRGLLPESEFETVEIASCRLEEIDRDLVAYVETLNPAELESVKNYVTTDGKPYSNVLRDLLVHLANHSSYHRGQIATLMRQVGAIPQATDFILYCRTMPAT